MTLSEALWRNAELEAALVARDEMIAQLHEQIRLLQERLAQNSRNSSRPPSSDGPNVKLPPKRRKSKRQRGGQPGHQGHSRSLVPVDQVDEIIPCVPERCSGCGEALTGLDTDPERHQQVDIPEPRVIVTEFQIHRLPCPRCGQVTAGELPAGVTWSRFGPRAHALVTLLTGKWLISKRMAAALMGLVFGLDVSWSTVSAMERRTAEALAAPVAAAHEHVKGSGVVHADESSWREAKNRAWLWVAATSLVIVFLIQRRRNAEAAQVLLGEDFAGQLCTDRHGAYHWVERRGLCWAHLLRDFQAIAERFGSEWHGTRLVLAGQRVLGMWRDWHDGRIDRALMLARIGPDRERIQRLLHQGSTAKWASEKTHRACRDLLGWEAAMWRFLDEPDLPPTNNLTERCLRRPVLWRKGSFGTDSADGSRFVERILTVVATLTAQDRDVFDYLVRAHVDHVARRPVASLLPAQALAA
jgi:transposase